MRDLAQVLALVVLAALFAVFVGGAFEAAAIGMPGLAVFGLIFAAVLVALVAVWISFSLFGG